MQTLLWNKTDQMKSPLSAFIPVEQSLTFIKELKKYISDQLLEKDEKDGIDKYFEQENFSVVLLDRANKETMFTVKPRL